MENTKMDRVLEIFFRGLRGEDLSVQRLADEYEVSTKSITRSINDLKSFLADHRELVGHTELQYSHQDRCYRLYMDEERITVRKEYRRYAYLYQRVEGRWYRRVF